VRDRLQDHRLTGLRRGDDQGALALAHRHDQVDDATGQLVRLGLQPQPLVRVQRRQLVELRAVLRRLRVQTVDRVDPNQRVELLPRLLTFPRLADHALDGVTAAQPVLANQRQRHVHVVRPGEITGSPHERVVLQHVEDAGHRQQHVVLADLGLTAIAAPPVAPAVAEPATPTAATFLLAVGGLLSPLRTLLLLLLLLFVLSAGVSRLLGGGATLLTAAAPGRPPAAAAAPVVLLAAGITGLLAAAAATAGGGRPVVVRLRRGAIALGRGILG